MAKSKPCYKLSRELSGHADQVRSLAVFKDGSIVSTSTDKTTRFWKVTNWTYSECVVMKGHTDSVCSVCVIEPTKKNPSGFIVTGSNDTKICIYYPGQEDPIHTVSGHEGTVCCLKTSVVDQESFLSSSTDHTGKLWDLYDLTKCKSMFLGHAPTTSTWCIADLPSGSVVTGGSDNTVIVYTRDGTVVHKLNGHVACVRDIAVVNDDQFLTCGNDAVTKHWNANNGACLGSYTGHTSHIYSVSTLCGGSLAVSCGEDMTVRVWRNAALDQTIALPADTVWSVKLLPNEDLVCGSSDGVVRIFTVNEQRYIDSKAMQQFELAIIERIKKKSDGKPKLATRVKENDPFLPQAPELSQPGEKDGDTVIVKEQGEVKAYRWSQRAFQWTFVGHVVSRRNEEKTAGKPVLNGVQYDHVFSVDIEEGAPLLKLPYNRGQDPYAAAQKFIEDNNVDPRYLDRVANFIMTNLNITPILNAESQFSDPFTGGSRYVTNSFPSTSQASSSSRTTSPASNSLMEKSYIPQIDYLKLEQGNIAAIHEKLIAFNAKNKEQNIPEEQLESVVRLASGGGDNVQRLHGAIEEEINNLKALLNWPDDVVFPALDIARLAVLQRDVNEMFCSNGIQSVLKRHLQQDARPSNRMLAYRLLANLFSHEKGEQFCLNCRNEILVATRELTDLTTKNDEVAVSTYILNLTVALNKSHDVLGKVQTLSVIFKLLEILKETEAVFRILVALGSLIVGASNANERSSFVSSVQQSRIVLDALRALLEGENSSRVPCPPPTKLSSVTRHILELINSSSSSSSSSPGPR